MAAIKIEFPVIGSEGRLATVRCRPYDPNYRHLSKVLHIDHGLQDLVEELLVEVRRGEATGLAGLPVLVDFDTTMFMGDSFGVALALSDRIARYGAAPWQLERRTVATGALEHGGAVGRIDGFREKIRLLNRLDVMGATFVFPQANLDEDPAVQEKLDRLAGEQMCSIRAIRHIDELSDFWKAGNGAAPAPQIGGRGLPEGRKRVLRGWPLWGMAGSAAAVITLIAAGVIGTVLKPQWLDRLWSPRAVAASDSRINAVTSLSTTGQEGERATCRTLVVAYDALTEYDRDRLEWTGDASRLAARADGCRRALRYSDTRIEAVRALVPPSPAAPRAVDRFLSAVAALTPFDREDPEAAKLVIAADRLDADLSSTNRSVERIRSAARGVIAASIINDRLCVPVVHGWNNADNLTRILLESDLPIVTDAYERCREMVRQRAEGVTRQ